MNSGIQLDFESRTPIYEQIISNVERYVSLNILKPNEQIPSIRELATELGVNPNTVKKAYAELENKGVIYVISTKGYFISKNIDSVVERKRDSIVNNIRNLILELERLGLSKEEIINSIK